YLHQCTQSSLNVIQYKSYETCTCVKNSPLKWWKKKAEVYPTLSKLEQKYLAVQATTAASERLFSVAKLVLTAMR
ncbi:unnamed protein product, partial [Hapterophycus canaliculatus]